MESDGVHQLMPIRGEWSRIHTEVWSCDEIAHQNMAIRALSNGPPPPPGAPEAEPLYFASADGNLFALMARATGPQDPAVCGYDPIEGEWCVISPSLQEHMRGWSV